MNVLVVSGWWPVSRGLCPIWRWRERTQCGYPSILLLSARLLTPQHEPQFVCVTPAARQPSSWWWENPVREDIVQNNIPGEWSGVLSISWNFAVIFSTNSELVMLCEHGELVQYIAKFLLIKLKTLFKHIYIACLEDLCSASFGMATEVYSFETINVSNQQELG